VLFVNTKDLKPVLKIVKEIIQFRSRDHILGISGSAKSYNEGFLFYIE